MLSCKEERVELVGTIRFIGNVPFTKLVLTVENRDYDFLAKDIPKYQNAQGERVRFVGRIRKDVLVSADGSFEKEVYTLFPDSVIVTQKN